MTVQPHGGAANLPANPWDDLETGLEDFSVADSVIPRITILHKRALFKDNLTNREFEKLTVVVLGLVKQRVMWDATVDDNDKPMCKSTDFINGYPNMSDETPVKKQFPWAKSNFDPADANLLNGAGQIVLPCASCKFKEWNTDPSGRKPWCNEQHTLPLFYDQSGDGDFVPALFTLAKSGLRPSKQYITGFSRSRRPMYTVLTEISLRPESRGDNNFAVPVFKQVGDVDAEMWPRYSTSYKELRTFLTEPPSSAEDAESEGFQSSDNSNTPAQPASSAAATTAPASPAATPAAEPVQQPASVPDQAQATPAVSDAAAAPAPAPDDDDLPF